MIDDYDNDRGGGGDLTINSCNTPDYILVM